MIIGVSFNIPQETSDLLFQILSCIKIEEYCWYNIPSQSEVWDCSNNDNFLNEDYYKGESFLNRICSPHFVLFLKLQGYFDTGNFFNINTYEEFCKSDCQILVLIYDCECVEIFSKDSIVTEAFYRNAVSKGFTDVSYITNENNGRTVMNIK